MTKETLWDIPHRAQFDSRPIPKIDPITRRAITKLCEGVTIVNYVEDVKTWSRSLTDENLELYHRYFLDRWTWDSDSREVRLLHDMLDAEFYRRKGVRSELEKLDKQAASMNVLTQAINELEDTQEIVNRIRDSMIVSRSALGLDEIGKYSITGEESDDANSKPSQPDNAGHDCQEHE